MDAIIMAGGFGQRLGMGEKPCVELLGKPLISYVIDTLRAAKNIDKVSVAVSPVTPKTEIMIQERYKGEVPVIRTFGGNYVADMIYAVETSGSEGPVMVIMSDLPLLDPGLIDSVIEKYKEEGKPALSVYVPINICKEAGIRPDTVFNKDGKLIVPTGVNILDSSQIRQEQEDFNLILNNPKLAINVNTVKDLQRCKELLQCAN
ncbi:nucleotidyltransferase [Methanosarcina sp. KYL-1]|uniref:NTP transferase domain-containing protein n=1 Tax=Methanosarcina sp. KYL-1 TaxID=2602068 RepID=UPI0021010867|nr:NTP transferase domain-containing protein [Methanosarcina sp. KYL-1]MCQ1535440.1 nucleotidyltransferase [Methanosarcina sp. KYL-1]